MVSAKSRLSTNEIVQRIAGVCVCVRILPTHLGLVYIDFWGGPLGPDNRYSLSSKMVMVKIDFNKNELLGNAQEPRVRAYPASRNGNEKI